MKDKIEKFLNQYETKNTRKNYTLVLNNFMAWSGGILPEGASWIPEYRDYLHKQDIRNRTINNYIVVLGIFYRYVTGKRLEYDKLKETRSQVEVLSEEEIRALLSKASVGFLPVLLFMLDTGVRAGELSWISEQKYEGRIPRRFIVLGKGGKQRVVVISDHTQKYLQKTVEDGYIFGEVWTVRMLQYSLKRLGWKAGINKNLHPHLFRHTFATKMLWNGSDITEVQHMLGHSNLSTTQIYTHISQDKLQKKWEEQLDAQKRP